MVSVVAKHEELIRRNQLVLPRCRPIVVIRPALRQIRLVQHLAIDVDDAVGNVDPLARQPDDALDEIAAGLIRWLEHDDVAALRLVKLIGNLRRHQQVVVMQRRVHARAQHVDGLHGVLNDHIENKSKEHDLERVPEERLLARWLRRRRRLRHVRLRHPLAVQLHPRRFIVIPEESNAVGYAICLRNGASLRKGPITASCNAWLNSSLAMRMTSSAVTASISAMVSSTPSIFPVSASWPPYQVATELVLSICSSRRPLKNSLAFVSSALCTRSWQSRRNWPTMAPTARAACRGSVPAYTPRTPVSYILFT